MYPLADSGRFVTMSALIAIPFSRLGARPFWGPCRSTLWPIRRLATYRLADLGPFVVISALIALPFGQLPLLGSLSLYPLAVSALSCVPFVSVPRRAPLSSHPFQVFRLSRVPPGPRRGTSFRNLHFLIEMAPWRVYTPYLLRTLNFLRPPQGPRKGPWVPAGAPKGPLGPPRGPEGAPGDHWVHWAPGSPGPLGPWGPRRCAPAV